MSTAEASAGSPDSAVPAVELRGITKRFPGVVANSNINIAVRPGTVHALVGENGAGKSTLMKTLYGMHRPDEGTIAVNGRTLVFHSPADAIAAGVGMVHQHFMLADNLTVWENIVLGAEPVAGGRLDARGARARIAEIAKRYGLGVDPDALVEALGVGARQRVEILKVLYRGAKILILDEPTAVLVPQEVDELFGNLRDLKAEGLTIIFISHKLDEVTIGLSLLCSLPGDVIERAMLDKNRETLLILAKALDFSWETTMALLFLGARDHRITGSELKELESEFGRLNLKTSRSVLEFYQSRKNAGDGDAGPKRQPAVAV